jgi:hypothetical protein
LGEAVHRFDKAVRRQVGTNGSAIAVKQGGESYWLPIAQRGVIEMEAGLVELQR